MQENGKEKLLGAVAKHTPSNKTSSHPKTTNLQEECTMETPAKQGLEALSEVAIKPGDIPQINYVKKKTVMNASGSLPKNNFFLAHPDHECLFMMVQAGKGMDSKMYIIGPNLVLPAHLETSIKPITCHLIAFPDGEFRILERKSAFPGDPPNEYQLSSLNVIDAAKKGWVMRYWDKSTMVYDYAEATGDYAPKPLWPKEDFMELLNKAYENRIIDSINHPIYLELAGTKVVAE